MREIKLIKPVRSPSLEKTRQRNIVKFLNAIPGCVAEVRTQTGYGIKGGADVFGCLDGRHFEFEVKQPKKNLTLLQEQWLNRWSKAGAVTGRVEDVKSVRQAFLDHGVVI